ncbi:unnamed protein product [Caenorhabditis auriculariae]|uniref:Uncharacterized protein n=1 Tax=Caenorhabditis auriculariae TaxID=2777116 RepID=A0A8S1HY72_9PELO|nr:unnamed protein product [Caenorhabditis auriculariae]
MAAGNDKSGRAALLPSIVATPLENGPEIHYQTLEHVWDRIGCRYPNFRRTILPLTIISFTNFFMSTWIALIGSAKTVREQPQKHMLSYATCQNNISNDSEKQMFLESTSFMHEAVPHWELSLALMFCFLSSCALQSKRTLLMTILLGNVLAMLSIRHIGKGTYVAHLFVQMATVTVHLILVTHAVESLPQRLRPAGYCFVKIGEYIAKVSAHLLMYYGMRSGWDMSFGYELTACCVKSSSVYLLAMTKTDELQAHLTDIFAEAEVGQVSVEALVDNVAFDEFEQNESVLDVYWNAVCCVPLIKEVFAVGIFAGCTQLMNEYADNAIQVQLSLNPFDMGLSSSFCGWFACVLVLACGWYCPHRRLLPVLVATPLMTFFVGTTMLITHFKNEDELLLCSDTIVKTGLLKSMLLFSVFCLVVLAEASRVIVLTYLCEYAPALVRLPVAGFVVIISSVVNGRARYEYNVRNLDLVRCLIACAIMSILVFVFNPTKSSMHTFFADLKEHSWTAVRQSLRKKRMPPAPQFPNEKTPSNEKENVKK